MAFIETQSSGVPTGTAGAGGAPTGSGGAGGSFGTNAAGPISPNAPGSGAPGTNVSQTHWIMVFIAVDVMLLFVLGHFFNRKAK